MKTEHFPSLDLCKKLTAIGFPTTFQHIWDSGWTVIWCGEIPEWMFVCPSVMEMLDVMPNQISDGFEKHYLIIWKNYAWYERTRDGEVLNLCEFYQWTPDALAYCVLWLQENNYISFSK